MDSLATMAELVTPVRLKMLKALREEMHPGDLAKQFDMTRQAVDKHLSLLYRFGLVDKKVKVEIRPKVYYVITSEGEDFLENFEDLAMSHVLSVKKRYKDEIFTLDRMLVDGEITESEYRRRKRAVEKRFSWVIER